MTSYTLHSHYLTDAGVFHKVSQDDESFNAQLQDTVPFKFKLKGQQITQLYMIIPIYLTMNMQFNLFLWQTLLT